MDANRINALAMVCNIDTPYRLNGFSDLSRIAAVISFASCHLVLVLMLWTPSFPVFTHVPLALLIIAHFAITHELMDLSLCNIRFGITRSRTRLGTRTVQDCLRSNAAAHHFAVSYGSPSPGLVLAMDTRAITGLTQGFISGYWFHLVLVFG